MAASEKGLKQLNNFEYANVDAFLELMDSDKWKRVRPKVEVRKQHRIKSAPQRKALRRAYNNGK